jgi:hypothetical protein
MKRYVIVPLAGTGTGEDPYRPTVPTGSSYVLLGQRGQKCLVLLTLPNGTAKTTTTVADRQAPPVLTENDPAPADDAETYLAQDVLTPTQQNAIKTWLTNQGIDVSDWTPPADRRAYFRWVRRVFGLTLRDALFGYDVAEG